MLDIGSGGYSTDKRYTSVDLETECDIQATMWDIPLPDNCVNQIYSSNALEHVGKNDVVPTLREWYRILEPDGTIQLFVPDFEWAVTFWLDHKDDTTWPLDIIFGNQNHDGEYHRTGFTLNTLIDYFRQSVEDNQAKWYIKSATYMPGENLTGNPDRVTEIEPGRYENIINQQLIVIEAQKML